MAKDLRGPYERAQQELAPKWLRRGDGDTWLSVFGQQKDDARRSLLDAVRNWFAAAIQTAQGPTLAAANDALIHIASNFDLERPEILTDNQFRAMILMAWSIWVRAGTQGGLIREIERLGFTNVSIFPVWREDRWDDGAGNYTLTLNYNTFNPEQNALFQVQPQVGSHTQVGDWGLVNVTQCLPPPIGICFSFQEWYWDFFNYIWSAFYVVIGQPHDYTFWAWGDDRKYGQPDWGWDGVKTGDPVLLKRLIRQIHTFKAGHTSCRGILFQFDESRVLRFDDILVSKDVNNIYTQTIVTGTQAPIANLSIWDLFNFGDGTKYGAGFLPVQVREEWEVDDSNVPNIRDQW